MDFRTTTVTALAEEVSAKRNSARELVGAALTRIAEVDAKINAFVAVDEERALADAAAIDARLAAGEDVGPLAGIPIGVKDLEDAAARGRADQFGVDDPDGARAVRGRDDRHRVGLLLREGTGALRSVLTPSPLVGLVPLLGLVGCFHFASVEARNVASQVWGEVISGSASR